MTIYDWVVSVILPVVTGLTGWIVGRKKRQIANDGAEIANLRSAMDVYGQMFTDMKKHIQELEDRVDQLIKENASLEAKLVTTRKNSDELRKSNRDLKKRIEQLESKLKKEVKK